MFVWGKDQKKEREEREQGKVSAKQSKQKVISERTSETVCVILHIIITHVYVRITLSTKDTLIAYVCTDQGTTPRAFFLNVVTMSQHVGEGVCMDVRLNRDLESTSPGCPVPLTGMTCPVASTLPWTSCERLNRFQGNLFRTENCSFKSMQKPLMFEYHKWGDIMGMFTWACARTCKCSLFFFSCFRHAPLAFSQSSSFLPPLFLSCWFFWFSQNRTLDVTSQKTWERSSRHRRWPCVPTEFNLGLAE